MRRHANIGLAGLMLMALVMGAVTGCNSEPKTSDRDLQEARVDYDGVKALLSDPKKRTVIVDPRQRRHYDALHIPGSVNIPVQEMVRDDPRLAGATHIVVYGTGWTDYISTAAAKKLLAFGHSNVFDLRGGIELWRASGGELIKGE